MGTFFVPEGAQWNALSRDSTRQRVIAGAALSAGLSGFGSFMPGLRSMRGALPRTKRRYGRRGWRRTVRRKLNPRKKSIKSGRGVTFEHDRQGIYRKSMMPRRAKRRWKRFKNKIHAVADKELGSRTVLFNKKFQQTANAGDQGRVAVCLYGWDSNDGNKTWYADLAYMARLENESTASTANGPTVPQNSKIMFTSGVLDLTMRNTSFEGNDTNVISSDGTLEVDLYEMTVSKDTEFKGNNLQTLEEAFVNGAQQGAGIYDDNAAASVGTPININQRGVTPFDMPIPLSQFGMKIWKKTKFFIKPSQTATYQVRDPKRHVLQRSKLQSSSGSAPAGENGFNKPGMTKCLLVLFKLVPGVVEGVATNQTKAALTVGVTRKYLYKIRGIKETRSIYINR